MIGFHEARTLIFDFGGAQQIFCSKSDWSKAAKLEIAMDF